MKIKSEKWLKGCYLVCSPLSVDCRLIFCIFAPQYKIVKKEFRNIVTTSLLALFLGYFGALTFFSHPHAVDGNIVFHAHPFQKSNTNHTHTKADFLYYQSHFTIEANPIVTDFTLSETIVPIDSHYLISWEDKFQQTPILFASGLRGPPSCC